MSGSKEQQKKPGPLQDSEDHECGGAASLLFTGMEPATCDDLPPTWSTTRRPLA
jgi:hypothetical protein